MRGARPLPEACIVENPATENEIKMIYNLTIYDNEDMVLFRANRIFGQPPFK